MGEIKSLDSRLSNRTKWSYCLGSFRDAAYQLVATFLILNVQYTVGLTAAQFAAIGVIMIVCRVWDAINDPMMGTIIENCAFKMGKYRPWILAGCLSNVVIIVLLFTVRFSGWGYVAFFGVAYLFWGMTFTMNDVSYWAMLPSLSSDPTERNSLTTFMNVICSIAAIAVNGALMFLAPGNTLNVYTYGAIVVAVIFVASQLVVVLGVKEKPAIKDPNKKSLTLGSMFKAIKNNDQLLWITLVVLVYYVGSGMLVTFASNFCYFEFGYSSGGTYATLFVALYAVGTIAAQVAFGILSKKMTRAKILNISAILVTIGYVMFILFGYVLPKELWVMVILSLCAFGGQGLMYLVLLVQMTNTIEYNDYKYGERNESIIFSLRSFVAKLSSAVQQGVFTVLLLVSGAYALTNQITELEKDASLSEAARLAAGDAIIATATEGMKFALRVGVAVIPLVLVVVAFFIVKKRYIIDEKMYDEMTRAIAERNADKEVS